ncbi:MAG TPA: hypothetical protein VFV87_17080 [Pirellulaceae bacterium]|nr:hypothetical protein [Pirellulaceae bacterium]
MRWLANLGLALLLASIVPLAADGRSPQPAAVVQALTQAAQNAPQPQESVGEALGRLKNSLQELDAVLLRNDEAIRRGWSEYLDLPAIQAELTRPQPDTALLEARSKRFYQNHVGLERSQFIDVRSELRGYLIAREYAVMDQPLEEYRQRVTELSDCLARIDASFDEADAHRAGVLANWLAPLSDEGANLADAVRENYCRTNGVGHVSSRAINLLMERSVKEQNYIQETMMGALTRGTAYMNGQVTMAVVPNSTQASLEIRLAGQVSVPSTVSQRGQITAYSSSNSGLYATKQVNIDRNGLSLRPAATASNTNMQIQDVVAPSRIIERLAWRRANRMLPEAQTAANRRTQTEINTNLDEQGAAMLSGVNDTFLNKVCWPMLRANTLPPEMRFWTDSTHLRLAFSQWNDRQLAPASPVPQLLDEYDMACGAHESMINNFTEVLLGGLTSKDEGWAHVMEIMTGSVPRPLWVHDRAPRWTATFEKERPFIAHFDGGRCSFTLRLTKVTQGDKVYEHPVEVEAHMIPRITKDGPALFRDGDLDIRVAPGMQSQAEAELRKLLARKVGAVFPPELYFDGLAPPAGGTIGRLRQVQISEMRCEDGWMTLGYKLQTAPVEVAGGGS